MIGQDDQVSIKEQCQLVSLSRSGYYYTSAEKSDLNLQVLRRIDELHIENPTWRSRLLRDLHKPGIHTGPS